MTVAELLRAKGFASALIIDDAFDDIPTAADLAMEDAAWAIFFSDVEQASRDIREFFPDYDSMQAEDLQASDSFIEVLWLNRTALGDLTRRLFDNFERTRNSDNEFLSALIARLKAVGLEVRTAGRNAAPEADDSSFIFADLFLGATQQDFDVTKSIERMKSLMKGRQELPPPVVLMSNSPRLDDKKDRFRDDAGMLGSMFRVYKKGDLLDGPTIETVLERLALHHADAVRVAKFINAWEAGLGGAIKSFMATIRRLDLPDYMNIRRVLLEAEGQTLGSYAIDVFDKVLQYQIEGDPKTISAAIELNNINAEFYPSPYFAGSPDFQELAAEAIWHNPERLRLQPNEAGMSVGFGDVLVSKKRLENAKREEGQGTDVYVVLTPACDLARKGVQRVLLVGGTVNELDHGTWEYRTRGTATPIILLPSDKRASITWDLSDYRTCEEAELVQMLADRGSHLRYSQLRENYALQLQQELLSDIGRVGVISKMPFTFPVKVSFFVPGVANALEQLDLPILAKEGAVTITGRDTSDDMRKLIFPESVVDELLKKIDQLDSEVISPKAKKAFEKIKSSESFRSQIREGFDVPRVGAKGEGIGKIKITVGESSEGVGVIARNATDQSKVQKDHSGMGIFVFISDEPSLDESVIGNEDSDVAVVVEG